MKRPCSRAIQAEHDRNAIHAVIFTISVGAQQQDVFRLILRESTQPVVAGLMAGTVLATGVVYLLRAMLYGINAVDGFYFVAVSILFLVVALLASYPPARLAMRVDPVVALRYE